MIAIADMLAGLTVGTIAGDTLDAVPMGGVSPAIGSAAKPKNTANGTPVSKQQTPKQILVIASAFVFIAIVILLFGSRILKDARI